MSDRAIEVFVQAEDDLRSGKFEPALQGYLRVLRSIPDYWRARFRVADTLLNLNGQLQALEIYKATAWHCIKSGHPLEGLVCVKMAAAMDRSQIDIVEIMAQLYSRESDRVAKGGDHPQRRKLTKADVAAPNDGLTGPALVAAAAQVGCDTENMGAYPERLPAIPLFSFLDEDAFVAVLAGLQLRRFVQGNVIIQEGQPGDSFFIVAEGNVEVTRQMGNKVANLARLSAGAVFGEMALISKAPRTATVIANNDCDLLELKRASLEDQAHKLASVTQALREFTHDRFLANLTATSLIFKPFPRSIRTEIVKKFQDFPVDPGDELIEEGEEGEGLFLIMKGHIEVSKKDDGGGKVVLATLKEGDVFGEISLIQESPTTATCSAVTRGELLFLPRKEFVSTMARHPELKTELHKLTAARLRQTDDIMNPEEYELIEDDDLIML